MAVLKQFVVTLLAVFAGLCAWIALDPRPGATVLAWLPADQTLLRGGIARIAAAPEGDAEKVKATVPLSRRAGRPTIVTAGLVGEAQTRTEMRAIGTAEAERSVAVFPDTAGFVRGVPVKSGDAVEAGTVLAVLEDDNERLILERARILLDAAEERLNRAEQLSRSRSISSVEVNDALRARDNARIDVRAAEIALAKRTITAPFAGRIGILDIEPGDLVSPSTKIATVDDRRRLRVVFYAPEGFVNDLSVGVPVEAVATARPGTVYRGAISAVDSRLDEASRTLRTEALIDNPDDDLRPGMSFAVTLELPGEQQLAVDPLAVQWERNGAFVWRIADGKVEKAPVRIVERTIDRLLLVSDALARGDRVVVEGVQSVREGGAVEPRGDTAEPADPADPAGSASPSALANPATRSADARDRQTLSR